MSILELRNCSCGATNGDFNTLIGEDKGGVCRGKFDGGLEKFTSAKSPKYIQVHFCASIQIPPRNTVKTASEQS